MSLIATLGSAAVFATLLPAVQAHMAMWHPSVYGFSRSYEPVTPLANKPFNEWWFHGYANERPNEVMSLRPGQDVKVEIACSKSYTSWGNSKQGNDACPGDAGSYHAGGSTGSASGWGGNSDENLTGCALAIAYKSDAKDVRPEDFIVMSVQENCVRWRDTSFSIPANLPSCPNGECTCAWFWQGKNSAAEMYMNGFRCNVVGGANTNGASIRPAEPRRGGAISGPTQPMYWANTPYNIGYSPDYGNRPTYNSKFGWQNGAQTSAFGGAAAGGGDGNNGGNGNQSSASSASSASSTSTRSRRPQSSAATSSIGNQFLAEPSTSSASASTTSTQPSESAAQGNGDGYVSPTAAPAPTGGKGKGKHCKRRRSRAHQNLS